MKKDTMRATLIAVLMMAATVQAQDADKDGVLGLKTEDGSHLMFADVASVFDTEAVGRAPWYGKPFSVLYEGGRALLRVPGAVVENVKADPIESTIGLVVAGVLAADLAGVDVMQEIEDLVDPPSSSKKPLNGFQVGADGSFQASSQEDSSQELEYRRDANGTVIIEYKADRQSR